MTNIVKGMLASTVLTISCLLLSGCWDAVEVSDRLYVLSVTVEDVEREANTLSGKDLFLGPPNKYLYTFEIPIAKELGGTGPTPSGSGGGSGGQQKPAWNIPIKAASITAATNKLQTEVHRRVDYSQLKAILIDEEIARQGIGNIIEFFDRGAFTGGIRVIVFRQGVQVPLYTTNPRVDKVSALNLEKLLKNLYTAGKVDIYIEKLVANYLNNYGYLVPTVTAFKDRYNIGGAAVFCKDKMTDRLEEDEVNLLSFITKIPGREYLEVKDKNIIMALQVTSKKVKKEHHMASGKLYIWYNIKIWGTMLDFVGDPETDLPGLQKKYKTYLEESFNRFVRRVQRTPECEYLGIGDYLSKYDPKLWSRIEKQWPEVFKSAEIRVKVDKVEIISFGERMKSGPKQQ